MVCAVGRKPKQAIRRNYKIAYDLLAKLSAVASIEDRNDTAQLERWIREGADRWLIDNPGKKEDFDRLAKAKLIDLTEDEI
jgi:hypothetical protein